MIYRVEILRSGQLRRDGTWFDRKAVEEVARQNGWQVKEIENGEVAAYLDTEIAEGTVRGTIINRVEEIAEAIRILTMQTEAAMLEALWKADHKSPLKEKDP